MTTPHIPKDIHWLRGLVERARECCDPAIEAEIMAALNGALANPHLDSDTAIDLFIHAAMQYDGQALDSLADLLAAEAADAPEQSRLAAGSTDPALFRTFGVDIDHGSEVPA